MGNRMKSFFEKVTGKSFFYYTAVHAIESYRNFEDKVDDLYRQSRTGKFLFSFFHMVEIIFRNSFLGRLTAIPEDGEDISGEILCGSRVFQYLACWWNEVKEKVLSTFKQSQSVESYSSIAKSFFRKPLQTGGMVLLVAIIFNSMLSFLVGADVSIFGIIMRTILFMTSFFCLFSDGGWQDLKETSTMVKKYLDSE